MPAPSSSVLPVTNSSNNSHSIVQARAACTQRQRVIQQHRTHGARPASRRSSSSTPGSSPWRHMDTARVHTPPAAGVHQLPSRLCLRVWQAWSASCRQVWHSCSSSCAPASSGCSHAGLRGGTGPRLTAQRWLIQQLCLVPVSANKCRSRPTHPTSQAGSNTSRYCHHRPHSAAHRGDLQAGSVL